MIFWLKNKILLRILDVEWFVSNVINDERLVHLYDQLAITIQIGPLFSRMKKNIFRCRD